MAFKKIPPKVRLSAGAGLSTGVIDNVDFNGVKLNVLTQKSLRDAYPDRLPANNFDLQKQIEAGVNLQEVNSAVLSDDINTADLSQLEPKNDE